MKYCPFCGAELLAPEVSFCAECGKQLPAGAAPHTETESPPKNSKKKAASAKLKRRPQKSPPTERLKSQSGEDDNQEVEPVDDYDGYYNDVEPIDAGSTRPGMDRDMIKKIAFLILGAFLVIGLCVVLMTVL